MFLGEFRYSIDDKGRLTIPAKFRRPLLEGMVITRGLDRNLAIYPLDEWAKLVEEIERLPYGDPEGRKLRRLIFSGATDVEPDRQGRVNVPAYLLEYGKIEKEVIDPDDADMLQDLIIAAVNDALAKSQEMVSEKMGKLTGGMNIPGMM